MYTTAKLNLHKYHLYIVIIYKSYKSIYRSFHVLNCRLQLRTTAPRQYSAPNKFSFENLKKHATFETSRMRDKLIVNTNNRNLLNYEICNI